ncbi:MAG: hypothetical protein U0835_07730 [Isosphaeraceae bacterium]
MNPTAAHTRRFSPPAGLIGMLMLVALAEFRLARHTDEVTYIHSLGWRYAVSSVPKAARSDVVAFGDSLVRNGVIPPVIEERIGNGLSVYNLAVAGGPATAHDYLFKRMLGQRGAKAPRAIVVDGETLERDPLIPDQRWTVLLSFSDLADLAWRSGRWKFATETAVAKVMPSVFGRPQIRRRVLIRLRGEPWQDTGSFPVFVRNMKRNKGAEVLPAPGPSGPKDPRPAELERMAYWPTCWELDPTTDMYNHRFLALAAEKGVPVFWLLPPFHEAMEKRRVGSGWYAQYVRYLEQLQERYPNLVVIDGRDAGYPPESLADTTHLNRLGGLLFSDALGSILRDQLDPAGSRSRDRWLKLPHYDPPRAQLLAATSPVEDTKRSGMELARAVEDARRKKGQVAAAGPNAVRR